MKRLFILISLFMSISLGFSQTYFLNVYLRDGTKAQYLVNDIQKIDFSGLTNINDAQKFAFVIKYFKLFQNYPNPFNPSTNIEYTIPKSGNVLISVYDLKGRLIKTLLNSNQNKGKHRVVWDGSNKFNKRVASGIYIYTIKFDNKLLAKKMILTK